MGARVVCEEAGEQTVRPISNGTDDHDDRRQRDCQTQHAHLQEQMKAPEYFGTLVQWSQARI